MKAKKAIALAMAVLMMLAVFAVVSATNVNAAQSSKAQGEKVWFTKLKFDGFYPVEGGGQVGGMILQPIPGLYNENDKTSALKVGQGYYFWVDAVTPQAYINWLKANGFNHTNLWGKATPITVPLAQWMVAISGKGITTSDVVMNAGWGYPSQGNDMQLMPFTQKNGRTITAPLDTVPSYYSVTAGYWRMGVWTDADVVLANFPAKTPGAIQFQKSGTYTLSFYLINDKTGKLMSPELTTKLKVT